MGFFDGTNKVPARGNSARFRAGRYPEIRLGEIKVKDGFNGLRLIVEGTVTAPPIKTDPSEDPTPLDAKGSWTVKLDGQWAELGKGDAKAFAAAVLGMTKDECETHDMEAELERAIGPDQPWDGRIVSSEAFAVVTKGDHRMTRHVWEVAGHFADQSAPALAAPAAPQAPAPTPPPAETPETAPGGPWYPMPAGDPRGTHYNAAGEIRSF